MWKCRDPPRLIIYFGKCLYPKIWPIRSNKSLWTPLPWPTISSLLICFRLRTTVSSIFNKDVSADSTHCSPRDTYHSPLSDYGFVDFDSGTYQKLYQDTCKNYEAKNSTVVASIRNNFKEFYLRVASTIYTTVLSNSKSGSLPEVNSIKVPSM